MSTGTLGAPVHAEAAKRAVAANSRDTLRKAAIGRFATAFADDAGAHATVDQRVGPHTHRAVASGVRGAAYAAGTGGATPDARRSIPGASRSTTPAAAGRRA